MHKQREQARSKQKGRGHHPSIAQQNDPACDAQMQCDTMKAKEAEEHEWSRVVLGLRGIDLVILAARPAGDLGLKQGDADGTVGCLWGQADGEKGGVGEWFVCSVWPAGAVELIYRLVPLLLQ